MYQPPLPNKKTNSRACAVLVPKGFKTKKTTLAYFLHTDIYEVYMWCYWFISLLNYTALSRTEKFLKKQANEEWVHYFSVFRFPMWLCVSAAWVIIAAIRLNTLELFNDTPKPFWKREEVHELSNIRMIKSSDKIHTTLPWKSWPQLLIPQNNSSREPDVRQGTHILLNPM